GIPRYELMVYLRDAADALDFMFEQHGLQHLDIKPENLLIQGEHVKVGDFGLAKDIRTTAVSLVGGFTPLYAPPELFEGEPQRTSDQYSLAIVYQVMLTGVPPFAGRTAAQLTAQHLRNTPDLSALQPVDRPVVARALSKNPNARFRDCRQFVDELSKRRNARSRNASGRPTVERPRTKTERVNPAALAIPEDFAVQETVPLPPVDHDVTDTSLRPAIFIAAGGLGGRALTALRSQLCDRFGDQPLPSFPLLYVDTDMQSINAARPDTDEAGLIDDETVCIPLRSSQDFRSDSELHLGWISRRWLYNIPRSRQVEGIRPLGRLALVDHQQTVRERLKNVIAHAVSDDAIRATAQHSRLPVTPGSPDVFIVAATSGGTGSGTVQDLGWMVRDICDELQIRPGQISAILVHGTGTSRQTSDLQEASTISFLKELQHFSTPGLGGPRGLQPGRTDDETPPFDHACFLHLGDGLSDQDFSEQIARVGDYLCTNAVAEQRALLRHWRELSTGDELPGSPSLRALGLASIDESSRDDLADEAHALAGRVLLEWFSERSDDRTGIGSGPAQQLADTRALVECLGLTDEKVSTSVVASLRGEGGGWFVAVGLSWWEAVAARAEGGVPRPADLFAHLAVAFDEPQDHPASLTAHDVIRPQLEQMAATYELARTGIREHIASLLGSPASGNAASVAIRELLDHVNAAAEICTRLRDEVEQTLQQILSRWADNPQSARATLSPDQQQALMLQSRQYSVLLCTRNVCRRMLTNIAGIRDLVAAIGADLLSLRFRVRQMLEDSDPSLEVSGELDESVVDAFEQFLLEHDRSRLATIWDGADEDSQLEPTLRRYAVEFLASRSPQGHVAGKRSGKTFPATAHPELTNIGGGRRVLALLPDSAPREHWKNQLVAEFGDCVTVGDSGSSCISVYCEVERIRFEHVLSQFTRHNPRLNEVASRVHSRNDIEW
ncbi:MAG: tubulin-like doman-containing protein, partial [Maioricimonas sp. JB045]